MSLSEPAGESSACSFYAVSAARAQTERARTQRRLKSSDGLNTKNKPIGLWRDSHCEILILQREIITA